MTSAELVDGRIVCDVPYRETALIKRVPGAKWHQASLRWRLPLSWASCQALRGVFGEGLETGPDLTDWAWSELDGRIVPALDYRAHALTPDHPAPWRDSPLYSYQQTAVQFLQASRGALLGDEMGLGKTPTVITAVQHWPLLVVCPKSITHNWAREIEKWAGVPAVVLEGTATQRVKQFTAWDNDDRKALVVSYDTLRAHSRLAPYGSMALTAKEKTPGLLNTVAWGTVVADEAHRIKDPRAKQTRALWAVSDGVPVRYALTGTPVVNNIADLWSLLRFVSPDEWPSKSSFLERYCVVTLNHWGGTEIHGLNPTVRAEFDRIFEPRYLRRTKAEVLKHLPAKVYQRREVVLPPKLQKAYDQMVAGMIAEIEGGSQMAVFDTLGATLRLKQMAAAAMEERPDGTFRMVEPSPKIDELLAVLEDLGDEPLVIFSSSRQLLDLACARLDKHKVEWSAIVGGMAGWERQDAIDSYNQGRVRCLLVSVGAGAEGFSLTRGTNAVFLDRSWSAVQNDQAEARLHGVGRGEAGASSITYIDLVTTGTIEQHVFDVLGNKQDAAEDLTRDKQRLLAALRGTT